MQLLSHCGGLNDATKPFYMCLSHVCKFFHSKKTSSQSGEAFNVMSVPSVVDILERWKSLGACRLDRLR